MLTADQSANSAELAHRFHKALSSLLSDTSTTEVKSVAVALSGGSDSLALLHLLHQNFPELSITALTVDHLLRDESTQEAEQVGQWVEALAIPHHILSWQHHDNITGNLQAEARKARYQLMLNWCQQHDMPALLLGHTQDDQAETIAYQQERAAGPVGLAGMSARRTEQGIALLRPLLSHTRKELQDWLSTQKMQWVDDPSNHKTEFARIRIRQELSQNPQRKKELLTLGKEMAMERLEIEQTHHEFITHHSTLSDKTLSCPLADFLALTEDQAAYTLGRILCHIGGNDYPPRYAKRLQCLKSLRDSHTKRLTLGHCFIEVSAATLQFHPEKDSDLSMVKPLVPEPFRLIFSE